MMSMQTAMLCRDGSFRLLIRDVMLTTLHVGPDRLHHDHRSVDVQVRLAAMAVGR